MPSPEIEAVTLKTLPEFAEFLHLHLQSERTPEVWFDGLRQHWLPVQPNYGFFLRKAGKVVGGIGAYYFDREIRGKYERFCNITSWCVLDSFRQHSMRLVLVLLSQPNLNFTDFSPTDVVGRTLRFLNFKEMDERVAVILNLPSWSIPAWTVRPARCFRPMTLAPSIGRIARPCRMVSPRRARSLRR